MENELLPLSNGAQLKGPQHVAAALVSSGLENVPLGMLEHGAILVALERHDGRQTPAARSLGICVRTLQRKLKRWRVHPPLVG
jgi:DNA-binding NtrC family response regulator